MGNQGKHPSSNVIRKRTLVIVVLLILSFACNFPAKTPGLVFQTSTPSYFDLVVGMT